MSRLEEIEKRLSEFKNDQKASRGRCDIEYFSNDIEYLLSEVNRYREALDNIRISFDADPEFIYKKADDALKEE